MMEKIKKAEILLESLPYIREFYNKVFVIKYGGSAMLDAKLQEEVAQDIVLLKLVGIKAIIVHGGGKNINEVIEKFQIKNEFKNGLRVTDEKTMEVTEMVLSGKTNKDIVTLINKHGGHAVGISGKDGPLLHAKPYKDENGNGYGQVGVVDRVDTSIIKHLLDANFIPVISPVGYDNTGKSYNINADTAAGAIASSLDAEKLIYLSDVNGVYKNPEDSNSLVSSLNKKIAMDFMDQGIISGGMIPKIKSIIKTLEDGVKKIHIINGTINHALLLEIFTDGGIGTEIHLK